MICPEAVRKHDGRIVAYESSKLAVSIARAGISAVMPMSVDSAKRLGQTLAHAVGSILAGQGHELPSSADVRSLAVKLLRECKHEAVADSYTGHSRNSSELLWRIRVVEPGTPLISTAGSPWDRRRLLEALRESGVARDPAGEIAREVERRIAALDQERISPALIHALAVMVLAQRGLDVKVFQSRRISFSLRVQVPRYDCAGAKFVSLPPGGPALQAFWLQSVHSIEVVRAVHDNLLSLEPYPADPGENGKAPGLEVPLDPLQAKTAQVLCNWSTAIPHGIDSGRICVCADTPDRVSALACLLAAIPGPISRSAQETSLCVLLKPIAKQNFRPAAFALPITINVAGSVLREALRDLQRATVRLAKIAALAALAHREREEYFNLSPVRGRKLPVAIAGLWNGTAWLQGQSFDSSSITQNSRPLAETLIYVLQGALETLRNETSMELCLSTWAPATAQRQLWLEDREFFRRDGITLDPNRIYDSGLFIKLSHGAEDFGERVDFVKNVTPAFDQPPAVMIDVPFGEETDASIWRELLTLASQAGLARIELAPGSGVRNIRNLIRSMRSHVEGFPLFEQMMNEKGA